MGGERRRGRPRKRLAKGTAGEHRVSAGLPARRPLALLSPFQRLASGSILLAMRPCTESAHKRCPGTPPHGLSATCCVGAGTAASSPSLCGRRASSGPPPLGAGTEGALLQQPIAARSGAGAPHVRGAAAATRARLAPPPDPRPRWPATWRAQTPPRRGIGCPPLRPARTRACTSTYELPRYCHAREWRRTRRPEPTLHMQQSALSTATGTRLG